MEGGQKTLLVIILIVIVVAGIIFTVRRAGRGTAKPPPRIAGEKIEKIDYKTGEFFTKTRGEWDKLRRDDFRSAWKNPKTGEYTVVDVMTCPHCGEKIPQRPVTVEEVNNPASMEPEALRAANAAYKCPKCGKCPYLPGAPSAEEMRRGPRGGRPR